MVKKATIYDVAKVCGVSGATVSRVLSNSSYPVSQSTRGKILKAAKALNYTPNAYGRALKTQQVRDIGIIVPNISNSYYAMLLQGVYDHVIKKGYTPILLNSYSDPEIEKKNIALLMQKQVGGIIIASIGVNANAVQRAVDLGYQVVAVEQDSSVDCLKVGFNFHRGAEMAVAHLVENGHRAIGFIGAPLDRPSRVQMLEGYRQALSDAGLPVREDYIHLSGQELGAGAVIYEFENGMAVAGKFCEMEDRPTGYVCINDMTALGAMKAFSNHGLRVPQDVSIIGFDNIPYAKIAVPELTSIDQSAYEMGAISSDMLIEHIKDPDKAVSPTILEPKLIVRQSVARAPGS